MFAPVLSALPDAAGTADTVPGVAGRAGSWAIERGPSVLGALVLLLAAWFIAGWVRRLVVRGFNRAKVDLTLGKFFGNIARWGIIFFAIIACLGTFGINTTSFAAVIGATGLAVGLALQGNLSNLASGVLLMVFRPFKIGDAVVVAGQAGVVDGIDLFTTYLDTADNRRIIVPNNAVFGGVIENQTRHPQRCVTVLVPVSQVADVDATLRILLDAARRVLATDVGAVANPSPAAALTDLTPAVTWTVTLWAQTPKYAAVRSALLREIKLGLDAARYSAMPAAVDINVKSLPIASRGVG